MNTKTAQHSLTRTWHSVAQSEIVFGGAANRYYSDPRTRLVVTYYERNAAGQYVAHVAIGRSIDYAENATREPLVSKHIASSPVFTELADAQAWCDSAERWTVKHYTGQLDSPRLLPGLVQQSHSYCSSCDSFDTLTTQLQAYGNLTTCTTEGCDFSSWYDIGD